MERFAELYKGMLNSISQQYTWKSIVSGNTLFQALCEAVNDGKGDEVRELALACDQFSTRWGGFTAGSAVQKRQDYRVVVDALFCAALKAIGNADLFQSATHRMSAATASGNDWEWGCVRTFLGARTQSRVVIPVALCDTTNKRGLVAGLELEVLEGGGAIFHHPEDALWGIDIGSEFKNSVSDSWNLACEEYKVDRTKVDGRWRLRASPALKTDGKENHHSVHASGVDGASAGGAVALGWYHAIGRTVPDPGVIVIASLSPSRGNGDMFTKVDEDVKIDDGSIMNVLAAKIEGIVAYNKTMASQGGICIDTICVHDNNEKAANDALKELKKDQEIQVLPSCKWGAKKPAGTGN